MVNFKLFNIFVFVFIPFLFWGQTKIQSSIKKLSDNCIEVYVKPDGVVNDDPSQIYIVVRWANQSDVVNVSCQPLISGMSSSISANYIPSGYADYTYCDVLLQGNSSTPNVNWSADVEYLAAKICFGGNSTDLQKIQQVNEDDYGGANIAWYISFASDGDLTNSTTPFYARAGESTTGTWGDDTKYAETTETVAIPLLLTDFTAKKHNNTSSLLSWTSQNEINFDKFELERSLGENEWKYIGEVKSNGDKRNANEYSFIDKDVFKNNEEVNFYYRLKMVDLDGKFKYSDIKSVTFNNTKGKLSLDIYPNPSSEKVFYTFSKVKPNEVLNFKLYNSIGKLILNKTINSSDKLLFDNSFYNFKSGIYNVIIKDTNEERFFKRIVLSK